MNMGVCSIYIASPDCQHPVNRTLAHRHLSPLVVRCHPIIFSIGGTKRAYELAPRASRHAGGATPSRQRCMPTGGLATRGARWGHRGAHWYSKIALCAPSDAGRSVSALCCDRAREQAHGAIWTKSLGIVRLVGWEQSEPAAVE